MTYQLDVARAVMDQRLREAEKYRLAHAMRLRERAERIIRHAHQALTDLTA